MRRARQSGTLKIFLWCSFFLAGVCLRASACSYSSNPTKIGRNCSVQVVDQGKPLAGMQIELSTDPKGNDDGHVVLTNATDERGFSVFTNVKPGPYYISIKHAAFPQSTEVIVDRRRTNSQAEKITLEWPGAKPLRVRSASGFMNAPIRTGNPLIDQAHPTYGMFGGAKLTRSRAVTNEVIESQTATESGAFGFQWVPAGLYRFDVEMADSMGARYQNVYGYVLIDIDPLAEVSTLNLFLYPGVCGSLGYENRLESPNQ